MKFCLFWCESPFSVASIHANGGCKRVVRTINYIMCGVFGGGNLVV